MNFPSSWHISVLLPERTAGRVKDEDVIERALSHPVGTLPLETLVRPGERICLLVNDITRLYQRPSLFLGPILRRLEATGANDRDLFIVIAGGMHGKAKDGQAVQIVGQRVYDRFEVFSHDCHDSAGLTVIGKSSTGRPIYLNKSVAEADRVIATGGIVPHGLAGFAGGGKSILPGIAGYETIQENHRLAFDQDFNLKSQVIQGEVEGNPLVHEIREAAKLLGVDFMLNVIPGTDGRYVGAVAGDIVDAHRAGCQIAKAYFEVPWKSRAPLVIASAGGYPRDAEMYQSIKALSNAASAAEDGGTIILLSRCENGIGHEGWLEWFDLEDRQSIARRLAETFSFPGFVAFKTVTLTSKYRVVLVSSLPAEIVRKLRMEPASSLEEALALVERDVLSAHEVLLMPVAGATMPVVREKENGGRRAHE